MSLTFLRTSMAAAALCFSAVGHTATLVNNAPNLTSGTNMSFALVAENFSLGGSGSYDISNLQFWSLMQTAGDYSGSVYWAVYSDVAGSPGSVLHSGTAAVAPTATGSSSGFGYGEYLFDIAVNFNLAAGGTYWLALQNGALGSTTPSEILWENSNSGLAGDGKYVDFQVGPDWLDAGAQHAFRVIGERVGDPPPPGVPTPATWLLALGGVLGATRMARAAKPARAA